MKYINKILIVVFVVVLIFSMILNVPVSASLNDWDSSWSRSHVNNGSSAESSNNDVNILYKKVQKWESAYLYLRNEYVKKLLLNNDTEELYSKSYTYPVELVLENNEILIYSI